MKSIDLNCDVGEGAGNDVHLLPLVTSANIACGGHAGDETTMRSTVQLAKRLGIAVGAHPGYLDRPNFGRLPMELQVTDLRAIVTDQIRALLRICNKEGATLRHVKPHGALYNAAARDSTIADAIARAVAEVDRSLILIGLAGSQLPQAAAHAGLKWAREAFADRTYQPDGSLTPRTIAGAVITDPSQAADQVLQMLTKGTVTAIDGSAVTVAAETVCIHGDGRDATAVARAIRQTLLANGFALRPL